MAITATYLEGINSDTDSTTYSFTSRTYEANRLYLIVAVSAIASGTAPNITSITSTNVSFTEQGTAGGQLYSGSVRRMVTYRAMPTVQRTGETVTITWAATSTQGHAMLIEFDGVDTSGTNGSGAIVQQAYRTGGGTDANATSIDMTLSAFGSADNRPVAVTHHRAAEVTTEDTAEGYTELADTTTATPSGGLESQWHSSSSNNTPSASWSSNSRCCMSGLEIKAAAGGGGATYPGWVGGGWF